MGPVVISTERLRLREWTTDDVPAMAAVFSDPEVARYINDGKPVTEQQATQAIARHRRTQRERGWCRWALEVVAEPGRLAGFCGVGCTFAPEIELGWTLRRDLWGHGYAIEAARAALEYCFATIGFERIISVIDPDNERSRSVAERLGMRLDGIVTHDDREHLRYAIENPSPSSTDPRFTRDCAGEPAGSSLTAAPEGDS